MNAFNDLVKLTDKNAIERYFNTYVLNFKTISLPSTILSDIELSEKMMNEVFDVGFDIDKTFCTDVISGIYK